MPPLFKEFCDYIVYAKAKTKKKITDEIIKLTKR